MDIKTTLIVYSFQNTIIISIKIWNIDNLKCTNILENPRDKNVNDIILCKNDLISCSIDHNIYIYNIEGNENDENNEEYNDFS